MEGAVCRFTGCRDPRMCCCLERHLHGVGSDKTGGWFGVSAFLKLGLTFNPSSSSNFCLLPLLLHLDHPASVFFYWVEGDLPACVYVCVGGGVGELACALWQQLAACHTTLVRDCV